MDLGLLTPDVQVPMKALGVEEIGTPSHTMHVFFYGGCFREAPFIVNYNKENKRTGSTARRKHSPPGMFVENEGWN